MSIKVTLKTKLPPTSKIMDKVRKELSSEMQGYLQKHIEIRNKLVSEWEDHNRPTFKPTITQNGNKLLVRLELTGAENARGSNISVYRMLSGPKDDPGVDGTAVRHAVMKNPYRVQTRYKMFSSYPKGDNEVAFVSKKIRLPGIKYRRWDEAAYEQLKGELNDRVRKGLLRGFRDAK